MVVAIVVRDLLITILRSYAEFKDKPVITTKSAKVKTFVQMVFIYYLLFGYVADLSFWRVKSEGFGFTSLFFCIG
jgi:phosphatidylglycerophosphate synthase